jgi:hypothetical protein
VTAEAATLDAKVGTPRAATSRRVVLLGPQRKNPLLASVHTKHGVRGPHGANTAGRHELEGERVEMGAPASRAVALRLHARADAIFTADPQLAAAHRTRQQVLRSLRQLYDVRLAHAIAAIVELQRREGPREALEWQRAEALDALRALDARHLARVQDVHEEWEPRLDLEHRPALAHHREEVARVVEASDAVLIGGGHVAILANRLRLFDIAAMLRPDQLVVGWAAGAMALTERIIVYHDSPPWGPGNAEVFDTGLGLAQNVVALPDAGRRLQLDDASRVARFARRFAPAMPVALEEGDVLSLTVAGCEPSAALRYLAKDGTLGSVVS